MGVSPNAIQGRWVPSTARWHWTGNLNKQEDMILKWSFENKCFNKVPLQLSLYNFTFQLHLQLQHTIKRIVIGMSNIRAVLQWRLSYLLEWYICLSISNFCMYKLYLHCAFPGIITQTNISRYKRIQDGYKISVIIQDIYDWTSMKVSTINTPGSKSLWACERDYSLWQRYRPRPWLDHTSHPTKARLIALLSESRSFLCSTLRWH